MFKVQPALEPEHCLLDDGGRIVRTDKVPWTRLAAPGFEAITYKILSYDLDRGYFVLLNTFDPGSRFRPHKHLGNVEIIMLSGSFFYENGSVGPNDYMLEAGGVTHAPGSDEGALMIAIFHGPLQITGPDGRIEAIVGIDELYGLAEANNAVSHLPPKPYRPVKTA
jgi:quercetin dioxygenase-like cupin family protein